MASFLGCPIVCKSGGGGSGPVLGRCRSGCPFWSQPRFAGWRKHAGMRGTGPVGFWWVGSERIFANRMRCGGWECGLVVTLPGDSRFTGDQAPAAENSGRIRGANGNKGLVYRGLEQPSDGVVCRPKISERDLRRRGEAGNSLSLPEVGNGGLSARFSPVQEISCKVTGMGGKPMPAYRSSERVGSGCRTKLRATFRASGRVAQCKSRHERAFRCRSGRLPGKTPHR